MLWRPVVICYSHQDWKGEEGVSSDRASPLEMNGCVHKTNIDVITEHCIILN